MSQNDPFLAGDLLDAFESSEDEEGNIIADELDKIIFRIAKNTSVGKKEDEVNRLSFTFIWLYKCYSLEETMQKLNNNNSNINEINTVRRYKDEVIKRIKNLLLKRMKSRKKSEI